MRLGVCSVYNHRCRYDADSNTLTYHGGYCIHLYGEYVCLALTFLDVSMYVSAIKVGVCLHFEISVNNFHVGPQVKMQIAAKLKATMQKVMRKIMHMMIQHLLQGYCYT